MAKILTLMHHESYISSLARTEDDYVVVTKFKGVDLSWNPSSPPPRQNIQLEEFDERLKEKLRRKYFDVVVCHTIKDLIRFFLFFRQKYVFIIHITLRWNTLFDKLKSAIKRIVLGLFMITHKTVVVSVSRYKADSWYVSAKIIPSTPGIVPIVPTKKESVIVVVGNRIKSRGLESGWDLLESLLRDFPITVIGNNPELVSALRPRSYHEFLNYFQRGRVFLFTTRAPYNDGWNLALLEAMQVGLPVVTIAHPTSPIRHEYNGLVGKNREELATHLNRLLLDPELAARLGENAKKTVEDEFSLKKFIHLWRQVLSFS